MFGKCLTLVEINREITDFAESVLSYLDRKIENLTEKEIKKLDGFDKSL